MLKRVLVLALLVMILSGCTAFSFLFDRLPFLVSWQADRMFDLNDEQERLIESGTEEVSQWLVSEGIPVLTHRLSQARTLWQQGHYTVAINQLEQDMEKSVSELLTTVNPHLIPVLLTLDEKNADAFRRYNDERKLEWFESLQSKEAKQQRTQKALERWFGALIREQEIFLSKSIDLFEDEYSIRLKNNDHWKERFLEASLNRDKEQLEQWLADPSIWWLSDYHRLREQNRTQTYQLLFNILDSITDKQIEEVDEKLEEWIDTLNSVL